MENNKINIDEDIDENIDEDIDEDIDEEQKKVFQLQYDESQEHAPYNEYLRRKWKESPNNLKKQFEVMINYAEYFQDNILIDNILNCIVFNSFSYILKINILKFVCRIVFLKFYKNNVANSKQTMYQSGLPLIAAFHLEGRNRDEVPDMLENSYQSVFNIWQLADKLGRKQELYHKMSYSLEGCVESMNRCLEENFILMQAEDSNNLNCEIVVKICIANIGLKKNLNTMTGNEYFYNIWKIIEEKNWTCEEISKKNIKNYLINVGYLDEEQKPDDSAQKKRTKLTK